MIPILCLGATLRNKCSGIIAVEDQETKWDARPGVKLYKTSTVAVVLSLWLEALIKIYNFNAMFEHIRSASVHLEN